MDDAFTVRGFLPAADPLRAFPARSPYRMLDTIGNELPERLLDPHFRTWAETLEIPEWRDAVRVGPDEGERLVGDAVQPMVMGGREMVGWLRVTAVDDDEVLREWVERGVAYARTLPPKKKK